MKYQVTYLNKKEQITALKDNHIFWSNPLLGDCVNGDLSLDDFRYIFSQYYFYSKNFTKLLAAAMLKCDDDLFRSRLSENLWEEGGEENLEERHAEIYRRFLTETLNLELDKIEVEPYTELFFRELLELCLNVEPYECFAVLSFGIEGIVARLYSVLVEGMKHAGLKESELKFFTLHMECDDDHALVLEEMACSYSQEEEWLSRSSAVVDKALNLRDEFFTNMHSAVQMRKLKQLMDGIDRREIHATTAQNVVAMSAVKNRLYENKAKNNSVNFFVDRVDLNASVLDPRLLTVFPNSSNELHKHAHETVFFILSGEGEVVLGNKIKSIQQGDFVYVPRWVEHQTRNISNEDLKILAITDFGLTKRLSGNTDKSYRQNRIVA